MGTSDRQTWAGAPSLDQPEVDTFMVSKSSNSTQVLSNKSNAPTDFKYHQLGNEPNPHPPTLPKSPESLSFIQNGSYNSLRSLRQSNAAPLQEGTHATRHEASRALQNDSPEPDRYSENVASRAEYKDPNRASTIMPECNLDLQSSTTSMVSPTAELNTNNLLQRLLSRPRQKPPHPSLPTINEKHTPIRATRYEILDDFDKHDLSIMTRYHQDLERIKQKNYETIEEWKRDRENLDIKMAWAIKKAKRGTKYDYIDDEEAVRQARRLAVGSTTNEDPESVGTGTGTVVLRGGGLWKRTKKATEAVTRFAFAIPEDPDMKSCTSGSASGTKTANTTKKAAATPQLLPKVWPRPMDVVIPTNPPPPPKPPVQGNLPGQAPPGQAVQQQGARAQDASLYGDDSDDETDAGTLWPRQSEIDARSRKSI